MAPIQSNPDLPTSYQVPGIYGYISTQGTGPTPLNRRVLFLGYKTGAGAWPAGVPVRANNEEDVTTGAGKGSECHRYYRALQAQGAAGGEVWFLPMNAPSGTAQTRIIRVLALPTTDGHYGSSPGGVLDLDAKTGALAAGVWTLWICGYRCDCIIANGDTYATIATNMLAEINKVVDFLPCTAAAGTGTITLTARHAALTGADLPVISTFSNATAMYLAASCGTLTYATDATADGTSLLYCSTQSVSTAVTNGNTPVQTAALGITAINNANAFPLSAAKASASAVLTLIYQNDRVVNWLATAITPAGTIGTTLTPAIGAHAAGLPSSSTPSLATALSNAANQDAYKLWVTTFTGAGSYITDAQVTQVGSAQDYSILGVLSTHIESQGNGRNCKGQVLIFADTRALATAGATQAATSPALTASPRYFPCFIPACPQQALEMAARVAARVISQDFLPQNYAGMTLTSNGQVPLLGTHAAVAMSDSDANAAMISYNMTPIRLNPDNSYAIVSGRTSAKPSAAMDVRYQWWGEILSVDYFRDDLRSWLGSLLKGKSIKAYSQPNTGNCISPDAVRDLVVSRMITWDGLDFYDGADALKDYVAAGVNASLPSRIDVSMPVRVPVPLEQVSIYMQNVA